MRGLGWKLQSWNKGLHSGSSYSTQHIRQYTKDKHTFFYFLYYINHQVIRCFLLFFLFFYYLIEKHHTTELTALSPRQKHRCTWMCSKQMRTQCRWRKQEAWMGPNSSSNPTGIFCRYCLLCERVYGNSSSSVWCPTASAGRASANLMCSASNHSTPSHRPVENAR